MKILLLLLLTSCVSATQFCSKVKSVGGCTSSGKCGVQLDDGEFTQAYTPVVGKNVCYYKHVEFPTRTK